MGCARSRIRIRIVAKIIFVLAFASPAGWVGLLGRAVAVLLVAKEEVFRIVAILGVVGVYLAWVSGSLTACAAASKWCCELRRIRDCW